MLWGIRLVESDVLEVTLSEISCTFNDSISIPWGKNRHKPGLLMVCNFAGDEPHFTVVCERGMLAVFLKKS